jgi:hypothetical protein
VVVILHIGNNLQVAWVVYANKQRVYVFA